MCENNEVKKKLPNEKTMCENHEVKIKLSIFDDWELDIDNLYRKEKEQIFCYKCHDPFKYSHVYIEKLNINNVIHYIITYSENNVGHYECDNMVQCTKESNSISNAIKYYTIYR